MKTALGFILGFCRGLGIASILGAILCLGMGKHFLGPSTPKIVAAGLLLGILAHLAIRWFGLSQNRQSHT